jgi:hypothetical protein
MRKRDAITHASRTKIFSKQQSGSCLSRIELQRGGEVPDEPAEQLSFLGEAQAQQHVLRRQQVRDLHGVCLA